MYRVGKRWVVAVIYGVSSHTPEIVGEYVSERNAALAAYRHERRNRRRKVVRGSKRNTLIRARSRAYAAALRRIAEREAEDMQVAAIREMIARWNEPQSEGAQLVLAF